MKAKLNPTLVGVFVLGAFVLAVVAVLAFGDASLFTKPQRFVIYVNESAHGLDPGASVKLRGVRVGRVAEINVRFDARRHYSEVEIVGEISKNVIIDSAGERIDFSAEGVLDDLIQQGLRAELAVASLATGMLYVELGFFDPREHPLPPAVPADARYPVVPAVPSAIAEFTASVSGLLGKLNQVDYAGVVGEFRALLVATRTRVEALDLPPLVAELTAAAKAVRETASDPQIPVAFANLNRALQAATVAMEQIDRQAGPVGDELKLTLAEARAALEQFGAASDGLRRLVGPQQGLGEETVRTLQRVAEAAESLQRLVEFLERNPASLLLGRPPEKR